MLDVLQRKVKEGVLVRLIYDDVGSIKTLPKNFEARLKAMKPVIVFSRLPDVVPHLQKHRRKAPDCFSLYFNPRILPMSGEAMFVNMLGAMERAEDFIFLEYFIIDGGEMLDAMLDVLQVLCNAKHRNH